MTTIACQNGVFAGGKPRSSANVSWHVAWSLKNPERAVSEEVHCFVERAEALPRSPELFPVLGALSATEESPIPLTLRFLEMPWTTVRRCPRSKIDLGRWECRRAWPAVIEMRVARQMSDFSSISAMGLQTCLKIIVSTSSFVHP